MKINLTLFVKSDQPDFSSSAIYVTKGVNFFFLIDFQFRDLNFHLQFLIVIPFDGVLVGVESDNDHSWGKHFI